MEYIVPIVVIAALGFVFYVKSKRNKAQKDPGGNGAGGKDNELF